MVGFAPAEINTAESTRKARLKWVVVVDSALPAGRSINAAVCVASATGDAICGLLGPDVKDAGGSIHPGLPWGGCSILAADGDQLTALRAKAAGAEDMYVADMPAAAQETRVYDDYARTVESTPGEQLRYYAISIVGPRNRVDKLTKKLSLA